ncbi:MAG TPA: CHAT domain-containing protein [Blastocatellia bacterium]|nr:CHAT domain-containing protein [Blastocatellia bacterium]
MLRLRTTVMMALALLGLTLAILAQANAARPLEHGKAMERTLDAGQTHSYLIQTTARQFARVLVEQQNFDVVLTLRTADGQPLAASDNPNLSGLESLSWLAAAAGSYHLEIRAAQPTTAGKYEIRLEALRAATEADKDRLTAEQLFLAAERLSLTDKPRALEQYEAALQLRHTLNDNFDEAVLLHAIGQLWATTNSPDKAQEAYRQSLALFQSATGGGWDTLFANMSFLYTVMGSKQKALDYLADALPLVRALRNRRLEAVLLVGMAKIHGDLNQTEQALERQQQALHLYRAAGGRAGEAVTITNIGDADLTLAERQKAIQYLQQSLLVMRAVGDKSLEATVLFGIGYVYNLLDERQKALEYFEQALPLFRALNDRTSEAYILNFIGGFYAGLGEDRQALDYFEQALPLFRAVGDRNAEAYALLYLGALQTRLGQPGPGLTLQQQALPLFRAAGDRYGEAQALDSLGVLHWSLGDLTKTEEHWQQALRLWQTLGYRGGEASTLTGLAFLAEKRGQLDKARTQQQQALALHRVLGNRSGEADALYGLARVERARGNLPEARTHVEAALTLIEAQRGQYTSPELRASFLATRQPVYQFHVDLLMQLHQQSPSQGLNGAALQASERARVRSLLEILTEARIDIRQGGDPTLLERERRLQQQLNAKEQARLQWQSRQAKPEQIAAVEKELRALTTEYQEVQAQLRAKSPNYAALTQPQPLSLSEMQQLLDAETMLLEYTLGDERSYLWAVTATTISSFVLPKRADIEAAARKFYETLSRGNGTNGAEGRNAAAVLSQMVLKPVAGQLSNKRLLLVTEGALQYVPFAALPDPSGGGLLIVNHELVSLPSASALAVLRRELTGRAAAPKTLAILADPVFSSNDTRVKSSALATPEKNTSASSRHRTALQRAAEQTGLKSAELRIPRLPGTRREAAGILALIPETERKQAFDFDASRATFTSAELSQYRFLHLATHGLLNSTHPELSGLVLSLVDQQGQPQDGFLRLHEIYNLKLNAELVTLSACQTALGKDIRGEGLVGLTRGFMYAGAPRVVASLWKVDDKATAELMKRFYQAMLGEQRLRPAAALRAAQVELLKTKTTEDPYYWAAFVLQGEWK